jgi:hypothetical protein
MKRLLLAIALTTSAAAIAQTYPETATPDMPVATDTAPDPALTTAPPPAMTTTPAPIALPSTGSIQAPGNTNPERDARGIAVISDAAIVPAGYNGTPATSGVGGPLTDPTTGEAVNTDTSHPPCTREVTDNCLQTYERGRSPQ